MFIDNLEIKSYGTARLIYRIDFQVDEPKDSLPTNIHEKKD